MIILLFAILAGPAWAQPEETKRASAAIAKGDYDGAIQLATEAARVHSNDPASAARDWEIIGRARIHKGAYASAIEPLEQAAMLDRRVNNAEGEVIDRNSIGSAYVFMGRYQDAYRNYREALDIAGRHADAAWAPRSLLVCRANLAMLYQRLGRYQEALEYYRQSPTGLEPRVRAQLLANQGTLYRRLGDPVKALELYREARALYAGGDFREGDANVVTNIGIALGLDLGKPTEAVKAFEAALGLVDPGSAQAPQTRLYLAEALRRAGRWDDAGREFASALAGARAAKSADFEWRALHGVGLVEEHAGRLADALRSYESSIAVIESMRSGLESHNFRREFLADKREVYDSAISLLLRNPSPHLAEVFRLMESGRARTLQDQGHAVGLDAIRARLDPNTALLEYWASERESAVLYVTRTAVGLLRRDIVDVKPFADAISGASSVDWIPLAAAAGRALLDGLPPLTDIAIKRFVIVPDGELSRIPFEVLGSPALIERGSVSYLPSASLLAPSNPVSSWRAPWSRELLALADPPVSKSGIFGVSSGLPNSAREVHAIAAMLPGRSQVATGDSAKKELVTTADLSGLPILHIASHAAADPSDADRSRILFAADVLFLREISALHLSGTGLVVLSACETEAGRLVRGEGVEGFSRAFLSAGAQTTVTSLWRVEDSATAEFMKQFYYRLAAGETKAEALRGAKLRLLHSGGDLAQPRNWAGFVMNGDGAGRLPIVPGWPVLAASFAALLAAAAALLWRKKRAN